MSAKLIFKMEFYKFINDKKYLIIAGVIALLNIILTVQTLNSVQEYDYYFPDHYYSVYSQSAAIYGTLSMSFLLSAIFLFIYPFHALALDYKNNVMAMMMASGVNRTKLYFTKIGSAIITSFLLMLIVVFIPVVLISIRYGGIDVVTSLMEGMMYGFDFLGVSPLLYFVNMIITYIMMIIVIYTAVIFMRGSSSKTVLLFFGFMILINLIQSSILNPMIDIYEMPINGAMWYTIILNLIKIGVFGSISLRQLNIQSL